jgi:hypothetical protein
MRVSNHHLDFYKKESPATKKTNSQGRCLLQAIEDLNLTILNGISQQDENGEFTYLGPNGSSVIYLCFVNQITSMQVTSFSVGSQAMSSHCSITIQLGKQENMHQNTETRLKWNKSKETVYHNAVSSGTDECMEDLITDIQSAVTKSGMRMKMPLAHTNPWYDKECVRLKNVLKSELKACRSKGSPTKLLSQYHRRMQYKALIKENKLLHQEKIRLTINCSKNLSQFWKSVKNLRPRQSSPNPIPYPKWKAFYDDIMLTKSEYARFQGTHDEELDEPFTMEE